jgi:hypothetical protein
MAPALVQTGPDDDPFAVFAGVGPQLGLLLVLGSIAIAVVWYARRMAARRGSSSRRSRRPDWADPTWRARVAALEAAPPTALASAGATSVRVVATIASAPTNLGGPSERACVWLNTVGAAAESAIAAELVFLADDSGRCAVEGLEHARVIAPRESSGRDKRTVALYVGDSVEVFASFVPERVGDDPDPRNLVYGTLGASGPIEIRVIDRPARNASPAPDAPVTDASPPSPAAAGPDDQGAPP